MSSTEDLSGEGRLTPLFSSLISIETELYTCGLMGVILSRGPSQASGDKVLDRVPVIKIYVGPSLLLVDETG